MALPFRAGAAVRGVVVLERRRIVPGLADVVAEEGADGRQPGRLGGWWENE